MKRRQDGRLVLVTTVVFDADVFNELYKRVVRDGQRSAVVTEAVKHSLAIPGWLEATLARIAGEEEVVEVKTSSKDGPRTRRSPTTRRGGGGTTAGPSTRKAPSSRGGSPSSPRTRRG